MIIADNIDKNQSKSSNKPNLRIINTSEIPQKKPYL